MLQNWDKCFVLCVFKVYGEGQVDVEFGYGDLFLVLLVLCFMEFFVYFFENDIVWV